MLLKASVLSKQPGTAEWPGTGRHTPGWRAPLLGSSLKSDPAPTQGPFITNTGVDSGCSNHRSWLSSWVLGCGAKICVRQSDPRAGDVSTFFRQSYIQRLPNPGKRSRLEPGFWWASQGMALPGPHQPGGQNREVTDPTLCGWDVRGMCCAIVIVEACAALCSPVFLNIIF
ncbi:hypothetical protein P7K49_003244 [Saguinus oedipus]|uniref:Uncharacterized protein n=1 Tax=Saguinus oedipus TaxID=9490 RepID=A0ABQ9WJM5_SAGOE|nr:hypothetical protein P7K49_003244 [Saguinus oedipus]